MQTNQSKALILSSTDFGECLLFQLQQIPLFKFGGWSANQWSELWFGV